MSAYQFKTRQDVIDFVTGCTFFGTGGGGDPQHGIESLFKELNEGRTPGFVDAEDIPDDATVACPFLMGSIAPMTDETRAQMRLFGLGERVNGDREMLAKAVIALSSYTGRQIDALVPVELGGGNTAGCVAAASMNGMLAVNGDFTGRAIPEITQTTPYLLGKSLLPITTVDAWDNVCVQRDATSYQMAERIGKMISAASFGSTGDAGFLMSGRELKEVLVKGTLGECLRVGRLIREADGDAVEQVCAALDCELVFRGFVDEKNWEDKLGYFWGTHVIRGEGTFADDTLKVWFKNENHVCWYNENVLATSPDSIIIVDANTCQPITNTNIAKGQHVAVLLRPSQAIFRSPKALSVLGPRAFGFDMDYVPVETLKRRVR